MKNKMIQTTIAILVAGTSMAAIAETNAVSFKATKQANFALPVANDAHKERVEYIWPTPQQTSNDITLNQQIKSDEYWQTVTGAELNKGVAVFAAHDALVRIAPMATYQSGSRQQSAALNMQSVNVVKKNSDSVSLSPLASQQDMEAAGFFDGSISFKLNNPDGESFKLQTQQQLTSSSQYLIHVKEKGRAALNITSENRIASGQQALKFNADIMGAKLIPFATKAKLLAPNGESYDAKFTGDDVLFAEPLQQYGAKAGLYEVQLTTTANVNGKLVKRSVKIPFVNIAQTASIASQQQLDVGKIAVNVNEPGRYNLKATLVGTHENGQEQRLQTVEVAKWLVSDGEFSMPFELAKFDNFSDLKLVDVKLTDQSRLMTLQVMSDFL